MPRIVIGENSSVPDMVCFLASRDIVCRHAGGLLLSWLLVLTRFLNANRYPLRSKTLCYCFAALSVLAFGFTGAVLTAAFGGALSLRTAPQGSPLFCSGILPSERL